VNSTKIGYGLSGLLGVGIIGIGGRFLVAPQTAAAGYGIPLVKGDAAGDPYLAAKGVRDIASGLVVFALLTAKKPRILARYLVATSVVPIGDAANVLRHNGPKATAYGVHGATAGVMLATAVLLSSGTEGERA
jgi:hypothetical protein